MMTKLSLTRWEWRALSHGINLADGHARQSLAGHEEELIASLPSLYEESHIISQTEAETRFLRDFSTLLMLMPNTTLENQRPLFHYSSSVSIDVVAKLARSRRLQVHLISPTFDNIPAILRRNEVNILPLFEKDIFLNGVNHALFKEKIGAIFLVNPNNPTGRFYDQYLLSDICKFCAQEGAVLIIDNSFRAFRPHPAYDDIGLLFSSGCSFITIEDTGKFLSTSDIKLGFILCSDDLYLELEEITDEILLNVSPFGLLLLAAASDLLLKNGGCASIHSLVNRNRMALDSALRDTPLSLEAPDCPIGVAWVKLPEPLMSQSLVEWLANRNFGILPGNHFYWHTHLAGEHHVRLALMRDETYFSTGIERFSTLLNEYLRGISLR